MGISGQVFGSNFCGECGQCSCKVGELAEKQLGTDVARFEKVAEHGKMAVDGVEEPEVGYVRGGEVRQRLVFLTAGAGELTAARHQQLDQITENAFQRWVGVNVDERRDVGGVDLVHAGLRAEDAGESENDGTLAVFALGKDLEVLAGNLDGFLTCAGVFVANHLHLGKKAGADAAAVYGNIHASLQVFGHGEIKDAALAAALKALVQNAGRGWVFGSGDVEGEGIGEDSGGKGDGQATLRQGLGVDLDFGKAPRAGVEGIHVESGAVFNEALLGLEMLRREKGTFGPDHGLELSHFLSTLGGKGDVNG